MPLDDPDIRAVLNLQAHGSTGLYDLPSLQRRAPATERLTTESPERSLGYNPALVSTPAHSKSLTFLRIEII
jgi:hypothetical protein